VARILRHPAFPFLLLALSLIPIALPYLQPGYQSAHDRETPFMRVWAIKEALAAWQLPPRWFPAADGGYGSPYPSFYGMLFYDAAAGLSFLGAPIGVAVELTAFLTQAASALGMYLLVRRLWGKSSGLLAAVFYTYAPFHLVDAFVRGAYSELASFVWFPYILLTLHLWLSRGHTRWIILGALSIAALVVTHNLTSMMFVPAAVVFPLLVLPALNLSKQELRHRLAGLAGVWALAGLLSAYFWLPILLERPYVHMDYFLGFDYHAAFVTLDTLVALPRGYALTREAGFLHLTTAVLALLLLGAFRARTRYALTLAGAFVAALVFLFMTTRASQPVWTALPSLAFVQFPWRFLAPAVFFLSICTGALAHFTPGASLRAAVVLGLSVGVMFAHRDLVQIPTRVEVAPLSAQVVCREMWGLQDYRPRWSQTLFWRNPNPPGPAGDPRVLPPCTGEVRPDHPESIRLLNISRAGTSWTIDYEATAASEVEVPQFYYPGWLAQLDGAPVPVQATEIRGLIQVQAPEGRHSLRLDFSETRVRATSDGLTLLGWLGLGAVAAASRRKGAHPWPI
jgi:uncharacterized membrane protein